MEEETKNEETQEEEVKSEAAPEEAAEEKPLEKMTSPELKEIAAKIPGATGVTAMKKDDLLALIKKHRGIEDEESKNDAAVDIASLKKKIVALKAVKTAAQNEKNKKEIEILRRRINRLKKKTRKAV